MKMEYSVVILAAGRSGRMGEPKFALRFNDEKIFLEEIVSQYLAFGCKEIVVVLNKEGKILFDKLNLRLPGVAKIVINHHPEYERFYSLKTGLDSLVNSNYVFIHNIDNPLVDKDTLKLLFKYADTYDYCVPVYKDRGGHPVLLSGKVVEAILREDETGINFRDFLRRYYGKKIDVKSEKILVNINTPEEYGNFFESGF
jgi:CTP:molybdopterin cytidylyltransferase MocA